MIKVSIIVPIYKVEPYLGKCLDSLINQTLKEIEIICVNDCSPDGCQAIINEYVEQDKRIVSIINQRNIGLGLTRNEGMKIAQGEYIGFVDSDDWVELNMFEKLYVKAKEDGADVVGGGLIQELPNHQTILYNDMPKGCSTAIDCMYMLENLCYGNNIKIGTNCVWNKIYNKHFLEKHKITFLSEREIFAEDRVFGIYVFAHQPSTSWVQEVLYHYVAYRTDSLINIPYKSNFWGRILLMDKILRETLKNNYAFNENLEKKLNQFLLSIFFLALKNAWHKPDTLKSRLIEIYSILNNSKQVVKATSYKDVSSSTLLQSFIKKTIYMMMKIILWIA